MNNMCMIKGLKAYKILQTLNDEGCLHCGSHNMGLQEEYTYTPSYPTFDSYFFIEPKIVSPSAVKITIKCNDCGDEHDETFALNDISLIQRIKEWVYSYIVSKRYIESKGLNKK